VSPRAWWRAGRLRPETAKGADAAPADDAQIVRLLELATEGATGALHLNGRWGGAVYLLDGRVAHVESALTPGLETMLLRPRFTDEDRWSELVVTLRRGDSANAVAVAQKLLKDGAVRAGHADVLRRTAMADAALAVLGSTEPDATRARSRFRPQQRHWYDPAATTRVTDMLAEVNRRKLLLARMTMGVRVYWPVSRATSLRQERVRLSSSQWDVVRLADGSRTPLDIAWLLGNGVFPTTVAVHQLARLGVLTVSASDVAPASEPDPGMPRHVLSFLQAATETASPDVVDLRDPRGVLA
jgi:hypothetical protein